MLMTQMLSKSKILYENLQRKYSRKINLDLTRIKKALGKLNNPHIHLSNVIQFAGSSGKFSCLKTVLHFLEADKKKVSATISPHLFSVRERFYIDRQYLSLDKIKKFENIIQKTKVKITLYELLVLIYFLACKDRKNIDFHLTEFGCGYRGDALNVFKKPRAIIISNLNLQHKDILKVKNIKEVCKEKCGYLPNNTQIFIGKQKASTLKIIKKVLKNNTSEIFYPDKWKILYKKNRVFYLDRDNRIEIKNKNIFSKGLFNNLGLGIYVALSLGVQRSTIKRVIPDIFFSARIQHIKRGKLKKLIKFNQQLIIDGCHAPAEAKNFASYLKTLKTPLYGIVGILKNKEPEKILKEFKGVFKKLICVQIPNEPNALSSHQLRCIAEKNNFEAIEAKNLHDAFKKISTKGTFCIFGSLYLSGHALSLN